METTVRKLPKKQSNKKEKRVAAYCRVSKDSDRLMHSLSAQVSEFSARIQNTPGWIYAGVYVDEGISGRTTKREGFQNLMKDCEDGKIDIILCKSVSRFARNTVDLLNSVRRLRELGIDIQFEREGINTLSESGELLLTLLATFAEQESKSMGDNIRWAIRKMFEQGITNSRILYGYKWIDGRPEIIPEEAEVVGFVYESYANGVQMSYILKALKDKGIKRRDGQDFTAPSLENMLKQQKYTGSGFLQKSYSNGTKGSHIVNKGELPMYFVEDLLPGIISEETYEAVQSRPRCDGFIYNKKTAASNPLNYKIKCSKCGAFFIRTGGNSKKNYWSCSTRVNRRACNEVNIPEIVLFKTLSEAFGREFNPTEDAQDIEVINISGVDKIIIHFIDGRTKEMKWR